MEAPKSHRRGRTQVGGSAAGDVTLPELFQVPPPRSPRCYPPSSSPSFFSFLCSWRGLEDRTRNPRIFGDWRWRKEVADTDGDVDLELRGRRGFRWRLFRVPMRWGSRPMLWKDGVEGLIMEKT